MFFISHVVYS